MSYAWQAADTLTGLAAILICAPSVQFVFSRPGLILYLPHCGHSCRSSDTRLFCWLLLKRGNSLASDNWAQPFLLSALLATLLLVTLSRWWEDRSRESSFWKWHFQNMSAQTVVRRLTSRKHSNLSLGGERRLVTYLFTDLEGFTEPYRRSLPPDQHGVNCSMHIWIKICDLITAHGATIDKIIGDAVVCFFGAPDADA